MIYFNMKMRYDIDLIMGLTLKQIQNNFFELTKNEVDILNKAIRIALKRCSNSFKECNVKRYSNEENAYFDPLHSGQYTVYLYYLSNTLYYEFNNSILAEYVYYLNKLMNGLDVFYEVNLPNVIFFEHPVGTVLGRAKYNERFAVYQNCTVGGNNGKYPTIGKNVTLLSYACILGDSSIGDNCIIASHTYIKDENIPSNSMVFGMSPNLIIKPIKNKKINIFKEN